MRAPCGAEAFDRLAELPGCSDLKEQAHIARALMLTHGDHGVLSGGEGVFEDHAERVRTGPIGPCAGGASSELLLEELDEPR